MTPSSRAKAWFAFLAALSFSACSVVELGGKLMRRTGETLSDYSKDNDGVLGKGAGIAGGVYSSVGAATEDAAKEGKDGQAVAAGTPATPVRVDPSVNASPSGAQPPPQISAVPPTMSLAEAQRRLTELGYRPGPIDGLMGKRTSEALSQFQRKSGIPASGNLDAATSDALRKMARPKQ